MSTHNLPYGGFARGANHTNQWLVIRHGGHAQHRWRVIASCNTLVDATSTYHQKLTRVYQGRIALVDPTDRVITGQSKPIRRRQPGVF